MKLYSSLASWWPLLSAPADYAEEAEHYWRVMSKYASRPIATMLELGCGGGNNASHLKQWCRLTLSDVSPDMLNVSSAANPECEHVEGDMCTLRLKRVFDAVFVHDAVSYLRAEDELRRAMETAFEHCAPGGVAAFVADFTRETWKPITEHGGHDGTGRTLRYLQWNWDPDPSDTEYFADMVYVLREGDEPPQIEYERHRLGLFPRATWLHLMQGVGFQTAVEPCPFADGESSSIFIGVR